VPVAAICGATAGLARAGILDDRRHTSNAAVYLEATGYAGAVRYVDEPAVTDGDLITAGATSPVEFAHQIFRRLAVASDRVLDAWLGLFKTGEASYVFALQEAMTGSPAPA
jgi:putative intracellular protease/amidase